MNPRFQTDYAKPAAPLAYVAFFEALRRANRQLLTELAERWESLAAVSADETCAAATLARLVREGKAFADLALQVHYGDDEPGIWHGDAANSLLHFAVSVRGTRALLYEAAPTADAKMLETHKGRLALAPGSVYLSSPAMFPHAVEYMACGTHETRILAMQARFLLSVQELRDIHQCGRGAEWHALGEVLSSALASHGLTLPSLAQVVHALAELETPR
jgi:hypothetical protein